jgi:anti-sigma B factor antagonist
MLLDIRQQEAEPGAMVISLEGDVMRGPESERIETILHDLLGRGYRNIIFDLSGVKRIDSTGIGRFIYSLNKVEESGGQLRMAGAQGYVRECFRVTRLDTIFRFCSSIEDASASLA